MLPDGVIYGGDEVVDSIEIPLPSELFIDICNRLNPSEMSDPYRVEVWKQYYRISQVSYTKVIFFLNDQR